MKIGTDEELGRLPSKELIAIIRRLEARLAEQDKRIAALEAELREAKQAKAPFSKGRRKSSPKRPGRMAGKGVFKRREEPQALDSDHVVEMNVPLAEDQRICPKCAVTLSISQEIASTEDIPARPTRIIKRFTVEVGRCPRCGGVYRGTHHELGRDQNGANAHQVGPHVKAQALAMHYWSGLPLCKAPGVIAQMTGIQISQSALSQSACGLSQEGGLLHSIYTELREQVRRSPVVNTDDTGWRINATLAFMMGFFTADISYYQIRYRHRGQEVLEVIDPKGKTKLGTDRGKSYEAHEFDEMEMQKCLSHLLKNLSQVEATKSGRAKHFASELKRQLREGLELWRSYKEDKISRESYRERGRVLEAKINEHLRDRILSDADNQRLLNGIGMQADRGRLTLFLHHPEIEPTNNRAERGLRPAVIARKVSHCSKNERGAQAYSVMKSIFVTLSLRTKSVTQAFASLLKGQSLQQAIQG